MQTAAAEGSDDAWRRRLRRIVEHGEPTQVDRGFLARMADSIGCSVDDLGKSPVWVSFVPMPGTDQDVEKATLGGRVPVFTDQEGAAAARSLIEKRAPGLTDAWSEAEEVFPRWARTAIEHRYGRLVEHEVLALMASDPSEQELAELVDWEHVMRGRDEGAPALAARAAAGEAVSILTPDVMYELAVRRRRRAEDEGSEAVADRAREAERGCALVARSYLRERMQRLDRDL